MQHKDFKSGGSELAKDRRPLAGLGFGSLMPERTRAPPKLDQPRARGSPDEEKPMSRILAYGICRSLELVIAAGVITAATRLSAYIGY